MERIKVLWLIKGLGAGGAEKLLSGAIPYLDHQTFQYEVAYLLPGKNDLVPEFQQAGIPVFCLSAGNPYDLRVGVNLVRLLRQREVDLLHTHLPYTAVLGRLCARIAGVRTTVYTEHSVQEMYHPLTRFLNRVSYPVDTATITVSDEVQNSSLKWKGLRPKMVRTISGGVDLGMIDATVRDNCKDRVKASIGIPRDHLVVGNVAHIRPEKGLLYLLEAAAKVLERYPKTTFVFVGREKVPGTLKELEIRAAQLGIQEKIVFAGFQRDAVRFMSAFDVFALPSLYEGLPIALLEAMAAGVSPVATAVGGIPEVIDDGANGFLVDPKNTDALAQKIGILLGDPTLRRTMSQKARTKVRERFSIQRMVESVEDVYAWALSSNNNRGAEAA